MGGLKAERGPTGYWEPPVPYEFRTSAAERITVIWDSLHSHVKVYFPFSCTHHLEGINRSMLRPNFGYLVPPGEGFGHEASLLPRDVTALHQGNNGYLDLDNL
ncbi:hypothetical protein SDJN03_01564, partial [Cucurbita argyrosperma subsp. sororia]